MGFDHIINSSYGFSQTSFALNPMYGKLIRDNIMVGGTANVSISYNGRRPNINSKAGPLLRYYFENMFFIQADYSISLPTRYNFVQYFYGRIGHSFFLNNSVAIEPYLFAGYINNMRRGGGYSVEYIDYGIYFSIQVYLESAFNKHHKGRKGILQPKQKSSP